jgi:hypothetical protein
LRLPGWCRTRPGQQKTRQAGELAGLEGWRRGLKPEFLVVIGAIDK